MRKVIFTIIALLFVTSSVSFTQVEATELDGRMFEPQLFVPRKNYNIRAGRGTNFKRLGGAKQYRTRIEKIGGESACIDGWCKVKVNGTQEAYIAEKALIPLSSVQYKSRSKYNVRTTPDTFQDPVGSLKRGTPFRVESCFADWCKIKTNDGTSRYVHQGALARPRRLSSQELAKDPSPQTVVSQRKPVVPQSSAQAERPLVNVISGGNTNNKTASVANAEKKIQPDVPKIPRYDKPKVMYGRTTYIVRSEPMIKESTDTKKRIYGKDPVNVLGCNEEWCLITRTGLDNEKLEQYVARAGLTNTKPAADRDVRLTKERRSGSEVVGTRKTVRTSSVIKKGGCRSGCGMIQKGLKRYIKAFVAKASAAGLNPISCIRTQACQDRLRACFEARGQFGRAARRSRHSDGKACDYSKRHATKLNNLRTPVGKTKIHMLSHGREGGGLHLYER